MTARRGCLVLVVGPSGAGKDSVIDGAREQLASSGNYHFVRRAITRPATAGGEQHRSVAEAEFVELLNDGRFALSWNSHGLHYGILNEELSLRDRGCLCIANTSRSVVPFARQHLAPVKTVLVTASEATLRHRLETRGRESHDDVSRRLKRAFVGIGDLAPDHTIRNDGCLTEAIDDFVNLLRTSDDS